VTYFPAWPAENRAPVGRLVEEIPRDAAPQTFPDRPPVFLTDAEAAEIAAARRRARPSRPPRPPAVGLATTLLLSLLAAFFAWVTAEPLLLAFGHGQVGTATVARCTGSGLGLRCVGEFTAARGFTAEHVALLGLPADRRAAGASIPARMVGAQSRQAYAGAGRGDLHLRWTIGLTLVLLCAAGIVSTSGARRLGDRRARRRAVLAGMAGPLLLAAGFLLASW
jgi:hypothetical protein